MNFKKIMILSLLLSSSVYAAEENKGFSLASLTTLLSGGAKAVTAKTMTNTAGVMEYCVKRKLTEVTDPENIKNRLKEKLGLADEKVSQQQDYLDGLQGLLKLTNDKTLDLNSLGNSALAEKVKSKACDVALKQGINFIAK